VCRQRDSFSMIFPCWIPQWRVVIPAVLGSGRALLISKQLGGRVKGRRGGAPGVCGGRRPEPRRVLLVGNQNPDAKETTHVPTSKTALLTDRCGATPRK